MVYRFTSLVISFWKGDAWDGGYHGGYHGDYHGDYHGGYHGDYPCFVGLFGQLLEPHFVLW
jgi:hypothetical protein